MALMVNERSISDKSTKAFIPNLQNRLGWHFWKNKARLQPGDQKTALKGPNFLVKLKVIMAIKRHD